MARAAFSVNFADRQHRARASRTGHPENRIRGTDRVETAMADRPEATDPGPTGLPGLGTGSLNVGSLFDSFELVRNAWSSFGVPSSFTPTIDLDELDRRIADLKTVEQWLSLNLNMLRTSVQALEIQRGTIAALKSYGEVLGSHAQGLPAANALAQAMAAAADEPPPPATARSPLGVPGLDAAEWWELLQRQFGQITAAALGASAAPVQGAAKPARKPPADTGEGAPVARGRKTPPGSKMRSAPAGGETEPGRSGRRPDR